MKRNLLLTLFLLLASAPLWNAAAHADNNSQNFCPSSAQSEEFVKQAIVLCMQDLPSQRADCMRDAEEQFNNCNLKGNFKRLSRRVQTKLIMLSLFKNLVTHPADRYKVAAVSK